VSATAFKSIAAPKRPGEPDENETTKGLRVSDKGFLNTAVIQSEITYIDGEAGSKFRLTLWPLSLLIRPIPVLRYRSDHPETCVRSMRADVINPEDTLSSNWPSNPITSKLLISSFMVSCPPGSNITSSGLKSPNTESCMLTPMVSSVHSGVFNPSIASVTGLTNPNSYDAHPMAILTSAFAYLGSYYSEANPSLQGTGLSLPTSS